MNKTIKLRVKREIGNGNELMVLKLKGKLISNGYTEIIHIADENEDFYLNSFSTSSDSQKQVKDFVLGYISDHNLVGLITLIPD